VGDALGTGICAEKRAMTSDLALLQSVEKNKGRSRGTS